MSNIVLIGMPGAGKSTIGVLLAKAKGYKFCDTDILIQDRTGELLYETINRDGIDAFLSLEEEVLSNVDGDRIIFATGGSAVYGEKAMAHLKSIGTVVYIKLSYEEIVSRVNNITTRGIAMKHGKTLLDVYNERVPLYEKYADITVECDGTTVEECVSKMINIK